MVSLILDSLGSTELLLILVVALMFFGPRKLPQLSRTIGKSLAEFRKASEDFKRTWEREVAMESARSEIEPGNNPVTNDHSYMDHGEQRHFDEPSISPIPAEHVMARQSETDQHQFSEAEPNRADTDHAAKSESLPKREWL